MNKRSVFVLSVLVFGFAFLYIPILSMIVFSFNESRLVTVWGGFSVKWYGKLLDNDAMLGAAWLSLRIATVTAIQDLSGTLTSITNTRSLQATLGANEAGDPITGNATVEAASTEPARYPATSDRATWVPRVAAHASPTASRFHERASRTTITAVTDTIAM